MNCRVVFCTAVYFVSAVYIYIESKPHLICCCGVTWHWRLLTLCVCYGLYFVMNFPKSMETSPATETFNPSPLAEIQTTFIICCTWTVPSLIIKRDILGGSNFGITKWWSVSHRSTGQVATRLGTRPWSDSEWRTDLFQLRHVAWIGTVFYEKAIYVQNNTNWEDVWHLILSDICIGLLLNISWRCVKS